MHDSWIKALENGTAPDWVVALLIDGELPPGLHSRILTVDGCIGYKIIGDDCSNIKAMEQKYLVMIHKYVSYAYKPEDTGKK